MKIREKVIFMPNAVGAMRRQAVFRLVISTYSIAFLRSADAESGDGDKSSSWPTLTT